jgi:glycine cleavage system H lipoate-binding protein
MNIPDGLKYTKEHEWVSLEGNVATIGIPITHKENWETLFLLI